MELREVSFRAMQHCIMMATDAQFAIPTAVALRSLENHSPGSPAIVVDQGLERHHRDLISTAAPNLDFIQLDSDLFDALPNEYPRAMFARIFLDFVAPEVDRVLYLDADTLVREPIESLIATDLAGCVIGAAPMWGATVNGNPPSVGMDVQRSEPYATSVPARRGIPPGMLLFNSGVMLVDRVRWREERIGEQAIELAATVRGADQALLNLVLWDRWMPLDIKWNGKDAWAAIAHFAGDRKPWNANYYRNALNLEYREVASQLGISIPEPSGLRSRVALHRMAERWLPPAFRH
jgi:lipopolysaccharide biosynthesis glycosyltransferase